MRLYLAVILAAMIGTSTPAYAGCGCDKPPPAPAAIIPHAAFPGMAVTLFHKNLREGQTWQVAFENASRTVAVQAPVVSKRTISDSTGKTSVPQLVVTVPPLSVGPTSIKASYQIKSFTVPETEFTILGRPIAIGEQTGTFVVKRYTAGVGADGTVYISVSGLNNVCQAMDFRAVLDGYPLQFGSGDIAITNYQGFAIEALDVSSADHFSIQPPVGEKSNALTYVRHSFAQHCNDHQLRGPKEADPQDINWHRDGTAHTDYSTLIFGIAGRLPDGTTPKPGSATFNIQLQADLSVTPTAIEPGTARPRSR